MNKKGKTLIAVYGIILVIWSVLFWVIPFPKSAASVTAYIFSVVALVFGFGVTGYAFSKGDDIKSKVYGFPIFRLGVIYTAVQIIFTLIIAAIGFFAAVPAWIVWVVSIVFAGLAAIGVIAADSTRDIITEQEKSSEAQTKAIKYFRLDMGGIADRCTDAELKKSIEKFADELKYSDPVSSDELEEIEKNISDGIDKLSALVNEDTEAAKKQVDELTRLLSDRNRRCKALKK